mgnify:CR=1 FL=1
MEQKLFICGLGVLNDFFDRQLDDDPDTGRIVKITHELNYSTVTLFARLRGLSTSVPRAQAVW